MGAFDGLKSVSSEVQKLTAQVGALDAAAVAATKTVQALGAARTEAAAATGDLKAGPDLSSAGRSKSYEDRQLASLTKLLEDFSKGVPANNQWAIWIRESIKSEMTSVANGTMKVGDAVKDLQRIMGTMYNALQQRFFGSQDPAERALLDELQRFILSGAI